MQQLVHTLATTAALAAVGLGLWQDWGLGVVLKKSLISYIAVFGVCALMVGAIRLVPHLETRSKAAEEAEGS